jgi:hypothetical protein
VILRVVASAGHCTPASGTVKAHAGIFRLGLIAADKPMADEGQVRADTGREGRKAVAAMTRWRRADLKGSTQMRGAESGPDTQGRARAENARHSHQCIGVLAAGGTGDAAAEVLTCPARKC